MCPMLPLRSPKLTSENLNKKNHIGPNLKKQIRTNFNLIYQPLLQDWGFRFDQVIPNYSEDYSRTFHPFFLREQIKNLIEKFQK